jgi:hypothetical protein
MKAQMMKIAGYKKNEKIFIKVLDKQVLRA